MIPTKLKKIKFKDLKLSAKFQYNEGEDEVWLKIGSNLITKWKKDEGVYWLEQTSRWVYEIVEEDAFVTKGLPDEPKKIPLDLNGFIFASLFRL